MGLQSELAAELTDLTTQAEVRYRDYMRYVGYTFDGNGAIIVDPNAHGGPSHYHSTPEREQQRWETFNRDLLDLTERFRTFYVLDQDAGTLEQALQDMGVAEGDSLDTLVKDVAPIRSSGAQYSLYSARKTITGDVGARLLGITAEGVPVESPAPVSPHNRDRTQPVQVELDSNHWSGPAASAFHESLIGPGYEAASRQMAYLRELAAVVGSFRNAHALATKGILRIARNCTQTFAGEPEIDASDVNNMLGLVAGAVGLLLSGGTAGVVLGVIGVGSSIVSFGLDHAADEEEKAKSRKGLDLTVPYVPNAEGLGHPQPIIEACHAAIGRLLDSLSDTDELIGRWLEWDMAETTAFNNANLWLRLPGEFAHQDFDLDSESSGIGNTVAPIRQLREAGTTELPDAARDYDAAVRGVESVALPAWLTNYLPRSQLDFLTARDNLLHLLRTTRNNLDEWGPTLVDVARDYDQTDGDNASALGRTVDTLA